MVHEMIDGTYRQTNLPNESPEYLANGENADTYCKPFDAQVRRPRNNANKFVMSHGCNVDLVSFRSTQS
jgi:hypothetical protein